MSGAFSRAENNGRITATGYGIEMSGGNNVAANHGTISAIFGGLFMLGDANLAVNTGTITVSAGTGILVQSGTGQSIVNSGEIHGRPNSGSAGIIVDSLAGSAVSIFNTGHIAADTAVSCGAAIDTLINGKAGVLSGLVSLNGGNDNVTNAGEIYGSIDLGEGNDNLVNAGEIHGDVRDAILVIGGEGPPLVSGNDRLLNTGTIHGTVSLEAGNDKVTSSGWIFGDVFLGTGNDAFELSGGHLVGTAFGGGGDDTLTGSIDDDILAGGNGDDTMNGKAGEDTASYSDSNGSVIVSLVLTGAQDTLGAGIDTLRRIENLNGSAHNDILRGNSGANEIDGGLGNDVLNGAGGDDTIFGRGGNDTINAGSGIDTAFGGNGQDIFVFSNALNAANAGTIGDFTVAGDTIKLENAIFAALGAAGALAAGKLVIGSAAADADDFLIYDSATGALFYDSNGNLAGGQLQFATLGTGLALTAADFVVI